MKYAITAIKKQDEKTGERSFLGTTFLQHYIWTKNDAYFLYFDSLSDAKQFWDKRSPYFPEAMMNEINKDSISAGNISFIPYLYLDYKR